MIHSDFSRIAARYALSAALADQCAAAVAAGLTVHRAPPAAVAPTTSRAFDPASRAAARRAAPLADAAPRPPRRDEALPRDAVPLTAVIARVAQPCPKRAGAAVRYACYVQGMTVEAYIAAVLAAVPTHTARKCMDDVLWDLSKGFIAVDLPAAATAA